MRVKNAVASCRRLRPMLGTFVAIECAAADVATAERAIAAAYDAIACVDLHMHPARHGSDLSNIYAAPVGRAVAVHAWTSQVLRLSQRLSASSEGCFDPCLPERPGTIRDIDLSRPGCVVSNAPVSIDLGGIAKGFAVDRAVDALVAAGCSAGVVNAGGDLRVFGAGNTEVWLRTQLGSRRIRLFNEACAVSDPASTARPPEHRGYYNRAAGSIDLAVAEAAAVVAPHAATADALTKCVLLLGERGVASLLGIFGARIA